MDDEERWAGLRTALESRIEAPDFAALTGQAERRRRQRSSRVAGIAVVVVVLLAIPTISLLVGRAPIAPGPQAPPTSLGTATTATATTAMTEAPTAGPPVTATLPPVSSELPYGRPVKSVVDAGFVDADHGFALLQRCPTGRVPCSTVLAVTSDGTTWTERPTPVPTSLADEDPTPGLEVLGPDRVLIVLKGTSVTRSGTSTTDLYWFSTDAGHSWKPVSGAPTGTIGSLPDGAVLEPQCQEQGGRCVTPVTVRLPATGALVTLTTAPHFLVEGLLQTGTVGTWWLYGRDATTGTRPTIARSSDHGRSWRVSVLPPIKTNFFQLGISHWESPDWDSTWYVTVVGELPDAKNGLVAIYRSTDAGASWSATWQAHGSAEPRSVLGVPIAGPAQRLTISAESGKCYASPNGGRSFSVASCPPVGWTTWSGAGYLSVGSPDGVINRSADGAHWTTTTP